HHHGKRPLPPVLVRYTDDGSLAYGGRRHGGVLQVHRGDPLPAGLDDVLGAVGQGQIAVRADRTDVARAQPAVRELLRVLLAVVPAGDPGTAHLQLPGAPAVVGQD